MESLPRSVRLAAWTTAWFRGDSSIDDVMDRVRGIDDEPHDVEGAPIGSPVPLAGALRALRDAGASGAAVALPRPGDPHGLAGPRALVEAAVAAGEAVLAVGAPYAMVPNITAFGPAGDQGQLVRWGWHDAVPSGPGDDIATAERALSTALLRANSTLVELNIAAWRPEVAQLLEDVRTGKNAAPLPISYSGPAQALAARAARLWAVTDFALSDRSAAAAGVVAARRAALLPLERAARHALVAACNSLAGERPS